LVTQTHLERLSGEVASTSASTKIRQYRPGSSTNSRLPQGTSRSTDVRGLRHCRIAPRKQGVTVKLWVSVAQRAGELEPGCVAGHVHHRVGGRDEVTALVQLDRGRCQRLTDRPGRDDPPDYLTKT
jgi:hypothetical protein